MNSYSETFVVSPPSTLETTQDSTFDRNALNSTFDKSALNSTFDMSGPSAANNLVDAVPSTPANRTIIRDRQKTMIVESPALSDIRGAFSVAKQDLSAERFAELERTVLSVFQRSDNEHKRLIKEVEKRHETELMVGHQLAEDFISMCDRMADECEKGRISVGGSCNGNCSTAEKLRSDLEDMNSQFDDRCNEYMKLHEVFLQLRKATTVQKDEYGNLQTLLEKERRMYKELKGKYIRLRDSATAQLQKASDDVTRMEQEQKEKTVGLRMKVRQLETMLESKGREIELKNAELSSMRDIINTMMREVQPVSDGESEIYD